MKSNRNECDVIKQHFVHKVDDGTGRLVRILLRKHVTLVRSPRRRFSSDKTENSLMRSFLFRIRPSAILRVERAERNCRRVKVFPEEKFPAVVSQRDALARHFEVNENWMRLQRQHLTHSFLDRDGPGQAVGVERVQVVDVARRTE